MIERFFYGLEGTSRDKLIDSPHILISAATLWNGKQFKCLKVHPNVEEIFLDSGGFSFFTKWAKYPFTTDEYVIFARQFCEDHPETKYVAVMDYPCEIYVNRADLKSNHDRINATLTNTKELLKHQIPAQWVSVVQGYTEEEYVFCCHQMRVQGLWTPLTAIGSICTRKSLDDIKRIIRCVKRYHPGVNLHAFGLEYKAVADREIWNTLYSVDTGAWKFASGPGGRWPNGTREKITNYNRYKAMVNDLFLMRNGNEQLSRWGCRE